MRRKRSIIFIIGFFLIFVTTLIINSEKELNQRIKDVSNQINVRVKNIELIQDFIVGMPALRGAIEFQSFGQIDIVVKRMMNEESLIKEFYILDENLNILHTVYGNYHEANDTKEVLRHWDRKSPYVIIDNAYYTFKKTNDTEVPAYVMMRVNVGESFNNRMEEENIFGVGFSPTAVVKSKDKFEIPFNKSESSTRFLTNYLKDKFLSYALFAVGLLIIFEVLMKLLVKPFQKILYYLQNLSSGEVQAVEVSQFPRIFKPFILSIVEANKKIINANQQERDIEFQKFQFKVAQQVAHDIRSPLGVLKSLRKDLTPKNEVTKKGFQSSLNRIEEIILSLLRTNEHIRVDLEDKSEDLLSLLENVLIEKKVEFSHLENVEIESDFTNKSYGLHSRVRSSYLKRIMSNLINNSVEAVPRGLCLIRVSLNLVEDKNVIEISDNGPGIAEEYIPHLFEKGFTTKISGTGLGLSGAKEEIERVGGEIQLNSLFGKGTTIKIILPPSPKSSFLISKIDPFKYKKVIVLDDDFSIHAVWDSKLEGYNSPVEHFYSPREMLKKYQSLDESVLLLSDYEFVNEKMDGVDVISKLNHKKHSVLITARSEEPEIRERCIAEKVRFISKTFLPYIEINVLPPHIVLIDDDDLSHWRWRKFSDENGLKLDVFSSIEEFLLQSEKFNADIYILLDSDLGDGVRGEIDGEEVFKRGFSKIYLYTSYPDTSFEKPSWIIGIIDKDPKVVLESL